MALRDYQQRAIDLLYAWMRYNAGNPCVVMPTGSGKSVVCAELCKDILTRWPQSRILVLSHVKELLEQDAEKILLAWPEAPLGIYSAGIGSRDVGMPLTVAGIQSIRDKASMLGYIDLVVVDEAHTISHKAEGGYRKLLDELKSVNPNMRIVGLTATPYRLGHGLISEHSAIFDGLVEPVSVAELVSRGYLAPLRSKLTDAQLSVDGVSRRGGEYVEHELQRAVNNTDDNERIVDEVIARAGNRRAWLFFCAGVAHSTAIRDALRARGVSAEVVTGETPKAERERIIRDYKAGRITALTNANVLCLDEETEILTSEGFIGIDDMSPKHLIAAWKTDGSIEFTHPQTIVRRYRGVAEQMCSFGGGISAEIRVTANHRMVVKCGANRKNTKVITAENLVGKQFSVPAFGNSQPRKIEVAQNKPTTSFSRQVIAVAYNYRKKGMSEFEARAQAETFVRHKRGLRFKNPDELSLDECKFIGFWLGDGTKSGGRYSISQSFAYPDNIKWAESIFDNIGLHYIKSVYKQKGNMTMSAIRWNFSKGTGGDKQSVEGGIYPYLPYLIKGSNKLLYGLNKNQLLALLEGLWKADGMHHGTSAQITPYITSVWLPMIDTLQAVCSMRGISATVSKLSPPRKANHKQQYRFSWGGRQMWTYTDRSSVLENTYKKERVWCVTSSTSFLICRRRGRVFVTGNTTGFDYPDIDLIAMLRPTLSPGLYVQMAGRGMRLKSHTDHCLVLDFAGNVKRHGPITEVKPPKHKGAGTGDAPVKVCEQCAELVHTSVKVCPACGYEFPPAEKEPLALHGDDIMGGPEEMRVREWLWYVKRSKAKQINMLCVDYYNAELTGDKVTEYITILHDGYARYKAEITMHGIIEGCGADISLVSGIDENYLEQIAEVLNNADAPETVTIKKDGRYYRVLDRHWKRAAVGA